MSQHSHTHSDHTRLNNDTEKLLILTISATPQELATNDHHKHFINTYDINGETITECRLMEWACDPKREYYCIFCGSPPAEENGFMWCRRCNEYKGIMPNCNP